jgi:hypothetical protein
MFYVEFLLFCVVVGCLICTTFGLVFWVGFWVWVVFCLLFGCGLDGFVSHLYIGVCWFFWVVVVGDVGLYYYGL